MKSEEADNSWSDVPSDNIEVTNQDAEHSKYSDNMSRVRRPKCRIKFNDEALVKLCEESNLSEIIQPQLRKQCWLDITMKYNEQHGTDFTKSQVVNR